MMAITFVCLFDFTILEMVPKQGAKKGIQNRTINKSGRSCLILKPTRIQLNGLIELIPIFIMTSFGAGSFEYWVLPGNSKEGYCSEKVSMRALIF